MHRLQKLEQSTRRRVGAALIACLDLAMVEPPTLGREEREFAPVANCWL